MGKNIENIESPKRNHIKIFLYLFCMILLITILVLLAIYFNGDKYKISNIVIQPSIQRFERDFSKEIQTTKVFVEKFINSYQDVIEKEVNPDLKSYFALAKGRKLSTLAVFSSVSEAFLCIYPSTQNDLIVECTEYPVQMALFSGLDQNDSGVHLVVPYEEALKEYNDCKAAFRILGLPTMISGPTVRSNTPRIFSFAKNSLVIIDEMRIEEKKLRRTTHINDIGLITGEKDFSFAIEKAEELGKYLAEGQISSLFFKSEFFRKALLDEHLSAIAKEINDRYSRAEKDPEYKYPFWEFKDDMAKLKEEAQRYGIDASYIDDLLKYPTNQPKDGYLLWYYSNYYGFSVQWISINIVLLIVFSMIIIVERTDYTVAVLMNKWWSKLSIRLSLNAILLSINAWVFLVEKPKDMNFKYWIIPGVLFVACFLLTVLKSKGKKQNS